MKRKIVAVVISGVVTAAAASSAFAGTPKGQRGYEGQPGNQGGSHQSGQQGYEGQPGNQSHGGGK